MNRPASSPLTRLLDTIGSVWFGVSMMVAILAYCWIGSASFYPFSTRFVRQELEKTEMEWFGWWPFVLILSLLSLSLILITVRKIKFNLPNLGVWTVHAGILTLIGSSMVYFGTKKEGDMAVFRRQAVLRVGDGEPVTFALQPGTSAEVAGSGRFYRVQVGDLNPDYQLRTGADAGKTTMSAQLMIQPFVGGVAEQTFVRQVLVGYPQYTEDVVPGKGRAIKVLGKAIIDDQLKIDLGYAPAQQMFLKDSAALHVRRAGTQEWRELPINGMPRYHEALDALDAVQLSRSDPPPPLRPLSIDCKPKSGTPNPLPAGTSMRVTGFLPFAVLEDRWRGGDGEVNPFLRGTLQVGGQPAALEMLAGDPARNRLDLGEDLFSVNFRWIADPAELQRALKPPVPHVRAKFGARVQDIPLTALVGNDVALAGTGYKLRGVEIYPRWTLAGADVAGTPSSMLLVKVTKPDGATYLRSIVAPQTERSQDLDANGQRLGKIVDTALELQVFDIIDPGLLIIGGPLGQHAAMISNAGDVIDQPLALGKEVQFFNGAVKLVVDEMSERSQHINRPRIIPFAERDMKAGQGFSLVRVEIDQNGKKLERWLEYSHYAYPTRMGFAPQTVRLPDGSQWDLLYSRQTVDLPAPVALEDFRLETYPGGTRERDFISRVRFYENGQWSEPHEVHSNNPTEHAGWWYFQATWDPPDPQSNYAGMNFTGLGVGNRHAVGVMLLGGILATLGTIWAFYIKPLILRRRIQAGQERRERNTASPVLTEPAAEPATVARMVESP